MKRQPTEEQKAKAKERREQFAKLCHQVAGMTEEQRAQFSKRAPILTAEGESCHLLTKFSWHTNASM